MQLAGHAVSMINADQYQSMPDQISGIDHMEKYILDQCCKFDLALIRIDRH